MLLGIDEGNKEIVRLHDELYTGPLARFLKRDLHYMPHIGIGLFASEDYNPLEPTIGEYDSTRYASARAEADSYGFVLWRTFDKMTVIAINEELTFLKNLETIALGA